MHKKRNIFLRNEQILIYRNQLSSQKPLFMKIRSPVSKLWLLVFLHFHFIAYWIIT